MLRLLAPAKINLALEILRKRSDDYHEIRTVLQSINLCDQLSFERSRELELKITGSIGDLPTEENLVIKAALALQRASGVDRGAVITLEKRIPISSGLGGGSSDAAQTLIGLRTLWELDVTDTALSSIAATIGSDVPFFLRGGTAEASGRGELIRQLPDIPEQSILIAIPSGPRDVSKTQNTYSQISSDHFTSGHLVDKLVKSVTEKEIFEHLLSNTFDTVIESITPSIAQLRAQLQKVSGKTAVLCGSGPSMFVLAGNEADAQAWYSRMDNDSYQTFTTKTRKLWNTDGIRIDTGD